VTQGSEVIGKGKIKV